MCLHCRRRRVDVMLSMTVDRSACSSGWHFIADLIFALCLRLVLRVYCSGTLPETVRVWHDYDGFVPITSAGFSYPMLSAAETLKTRQLYMTIDDQPTPDPLLLSLALCLSRLLVVVVVVVFVFAVI